MRHKDTAALREFLKGYREADEKDVHPTDQQERLPMPPMEVRRGGEIIELPERDASPPTPSWRPASPQIGLPSGSRG